MDHGERRAGAEFDREVAVGHGIEGICAHRLEAELARDPRAVDRKTSPGERRGAERKLVHAPPAVGEARAVALEHLEIGEQVVPEGHRLGDLQVREARHQRGGVLFRLVEQPPLDAAQEPADLVYGVAQP